MSIKQDCSGKIAVLLHLSDGEMGSNKVIGVFGDNRKNDFFPKGDVNTFNHRWAGDVGNIVNRCTTDKEGCRLSSGYWLVELVLGYRDENHNGGDYICDQEKILVNSKEELIDALFDKLDHFLYLNCVEDSSLRLLGRTLYGRSLNRSSTVKNMLKVFLHFSK